MSQTYLPPALNKTPDGPNRVPPQDQGVLQPRGNAAMQDQLANADLGGLNAGPKEPGATTSEDLHGSQDGEEQIGTDVAKPASASAPTLGAKVAVPTGQEFGGIQTALDAYNQYMATGKPERGNQISLLEKLDRAIYTWFGANPSPDLDKLAGGPELKALLAESEAAHRAVVAAGKNDAAFLPIDTSGMTPEQIDATRAIWRSIIEGKGGLKIGGDAGFGDDTAASIAHILQTEIGRQLLGYLAHPPKPEQYDQVVEIVSALPKEFQHLESQRTSESSYAMAKGTMYKEGEEKPTSDEHLLGAPKKMADKDAGKFEPYGGTNSVFDAVLGGKEGISHNSQQYAFGKGSGAYVKMSGATGNDGFHMSGKQNNEVLRPKWVTMAHELGHAAKMRGGAMAGSAMGGKDLFEAVEPNASTRGLWTNPEEWINISHIENKVREQSGIHQREYHKPLEIVTKRKRAEKIKKKTEGTAKHDQMAPGLPSFQALEAARKAAGDTLHDDAVFNGLKDQVAALKAEILQGDSIRAVKQQRAEPSVQKVVDAAGGSDDFEAHVQPSAEWQALKSELDQVCQVGVPSSDFYDVLKKIKDFAPQAAVLARAGKKAAKQAESKAKRQAFVQKLKPSNWFK